RFIKEHNINSKIRFLSDYAEQRFMSNTRLRIIEINISARAVIEYDENNNIYISL
ncbi:thiol peroxidase, partial [Salmonella enterica]|nr:thiol peroxidase [Salmonella enterica]